MNNIAFIMYSHTSYSDVWPLFFGQLLEFKVDKYFDNKFAFLDSTSENIPSDFKQILYNDNQTYTDRLITCLASIEQDYIFFQHEDMILYDCPDFGKIDSAFFLLENSKASFVKLIKGGVIKDIPTKVDWLKFIPSYYGWIFSIQPSIWKKNDLLNILNAFKNHSIWELENDCQEFCRENHITGYYTFTGYESKRGEFHWDSLVYPYIATAIGKGKWNYSEYPKELDKLFLQYNIDPNLRGVI